MKILFICKHNRFRSKTAEALFSYYNKNKKNKANSAGVKLDPLHLHVAPLLKSVLKDKGIKIINDKSVATSDKLFKWADKIIIVADNISTEGFPEEKTEVWKIQDCDQEDEDGIRFRVGQIETKVKELLLKLK